MHGHEKTALAGAASSNASISYSKNQLDFQAVNYAALNVSQAIVSRWLPDGRRFGHEWVARNPRRTDKHVGSFSINLTTGRWADFATGDRGGDIISLAAYLANIGQVEAARCLASMLSMGGYHG